MDEGSPGARRAIRHAVQVPIANQRQRGIPIDIGLFFTSRHEMDLRVGGDPVVLALDQHCFEHEGFASTIWDSSIVLSRYIEKHRDAFRGKVCVELGAGCGLASLVMAMCGGSVTATDLECNLELLRRNLKNDKGKR